MPSAFFRPVFALLSLPLLSACDSSPNTLAGDGSPATSA